MSDRRLRSVGPGPGRADPTNVAQRDNNKLQAENSELFLRKALDSVVTNVMIADRNHDIVYVNKKATQMFRHAADALRSELPDFDPEKLVGSNIDAFHREPMRQRRMLENLVDTYTTKLKVGGRTFRLIANPIVNDGNRLGTVVEWSDLTAQLELEDEARQRVEAEHLKKKQLMNNIIRELHHRIKNDLQGVVGLLRHSVAEFPESNPMIDDAIRQISAVATVYHLQSASVSLKLKLKDMVTTFVKAFNGTSRGRLRFHPGDDEVDDFYVSEEESVPLALIVNELLTNAVKHGSFRSQDELISVTLDRQADGVRLCIRNHAEHLSNAFDFSRGSGVSTGLELVRSLLPRPGSELSFDIADGTVTAILALSQPVVREDVAQPL